jgi:phosphatidylethanolamine-binding protein (PEBP) family uncharacterized protein
MKTWMLVGFSVAVLGGIGTGCESSQQNTSGTGGAVAGGSGGAVAGGTGGAPTGGSGGAPGGSGGAAGGAGGGTGGAGGLPVTPGWAITSSAFADGAAIPVSATCDGHPFGFGTSPALVWNAGPTTAMSYAIVFKDLSVMQRNDPTTAAAAYNRAFHWVIWDIPTTVRALPAMLGAAEFPSEVPGARQWAVRNQFGYLGPCPNSDPAADPSTHVIDTYSFTLYALSVPILTYPDPQPGLNNYTRTIHDYLETVAISKTELRGTSNAVATEAPPPLDASMLKFPSARP